MEKLRADNLPPTSFKIGKIEDRVIKYLNSIDLSKFPITEDNSTTTRGGIQTVNIINYINKDFLKYLKEKYIFPCIEELKPYYSIDDLHFNHIHFIQYQKGGTQLLHDHKCCEDWGFLLFLNDDEGGETVLYDGGQVYKNSVNKGKFIIMPSWMKHEGLEVKNNKKIFLIAIQEIGKKWDSVKT
jgi:hypothetical protein